MSDSKGLTNHEITIALMGGAVLGPFRATWSTEIVSDVRELSRDYDAFLQGAEQTRFKYHLHDPRQARFTLPHHRLQARHRHLRSRFAARALRENWEKLGKK